MIPLIQTSNPLLGLIAAVTVSLALIFYLYSRFKLNYWARRGVDSLSSTHFIFGNFKKAILFQSSPAWYIGQLYKQARDDAPYVGFYIFHKPCLLLRDPKLIKQILIKDFKNFSDRHYAGKYEKDSIGMRNLFGLRNPAWTFLRTKITPTLTGGKLRQMFPLMMETAQPMVDYIKNHDIDKKKGTKLIDAQDINYKYCTDLFANVALGIEVDSFKNPNSEFTKAVYPFFHSLKRMIALVSLFFLPEVVEVFGSSVLLDLKVVNEVFWTAMEKREKTGVKRGDFIDSIIQLKNGKQNDLYKFEGNNLVYQSGLFLSGFESSSASAAFTMMELARNKNLQDRAREDIMAAVEKHGWTYDAFSEMKFLEQCILEGLRLHPPVPTIDRSAKNDYKIPGTDVVIEKGTAIYVSIYGCQEDSKYFKDPLVYDPTRFDSDKPSSDAFIPFGVGPRMCVGVRLAHLHSKIVLAVILSKYEVFQKAKEMELNPRFTFSAALGGLQLEFQELSAH